MKWLVFFLALSDAFVVYTDLTVAPFSNVTRWSHKEFYGNHKNRQPTQPPSEWSNFTITLPINTTAVQLTVASGGVPVAERVAFWNASGGDVLDVSVVWWGTSWRLYIGIIYLK